MYSHVTCHVIHRLCMVYIYISAVYVHALQQVPYNKLSQNFRDLNISRIAAKMGVRNFHE